MLDRKTRWRIRILLTLVAWLTTGGTVAQPVGQEQERKVHSSADLVLEDVVDVSLIQLDAVVTDRSDQAIPGLTASDFALRVDGKKVAIDGVSSGEELRQTVSGRLTVVILIDDRHLHAAHRDPALREIERTLLVEMERNPTWVSIAAIRDRLVPLQAPTRDPEAVAGAIARAIQEPPPNNPILGMQRAAVNEVTNLLSLLGKTGSSYRMGQASVSSVETRLREYGAVLSIDTAETLNEISALVEALSFVPGRKAVLLLTDGLPRSPLDNVAKTMFDRLGGGSRSLTADDTIGGGSNETLNDRNARPTGSDRADNSAFVNPVIQQDDGGAFDFQMAVTSLARGEEFDQLAARANTHGVTFYPLRPPVQDASVTGLSEGRGERGATSSLSDMTVGLELLAGDTGGLFFGGDGGVSSFLERTREDLAAYYSLSFTPPAKNRSVSGIREMQLKIRKQKAKLRYRASYMPMTLEQRLSSRAWGTLLFGWEENLHGVELGQKVLAASSTPDGELFPVELTVSLPIGKLELVRSATNMSCGYRVVVQARRSDGRRIAPKHLSFVVEIPNADIEVARGQFFAVRTQIALPVGSYELALGLWEENSATSSFIVDRLQIGAGEETVAVMQLPGDDEAAVAARAAQVTAASSSWMTPVSASTSASIPSGRVN